MQVGEECIQHIPLFLLLIRQTAPFFLCFTDLVLVSVTFPLFGLFKFISFCPCPSHLMHVWKAFRMCKEWEEKLFLFVVLPSLDPSSWSSLALLVHQGQPYMGAHWHVCAFWPAAHLAKSPR